MRWLRRPKTNREQGAAGVLVAVMMLVLIGAGALAVDVGQIYAERAQLQNAADSGALAVVQACYKSGCSQADAEAVAESLANANSNDALSNVAEVDLSVANQATVRTTTQNGSNSFLTKMFASALNAPPVTVGAYAVAAAEPPSSGKGFPLALSDCQYDLSGAEAAGEVQLIRYKPGMGTCTSTSGHVIPGGFGWLDQTSTCEATTDADDTVSSDTGADYAAECDAILEGWIAQIESGGKALATFPVYDNAGGTGAGGWFHIRGYATFDMQGWKFGGGSKAPRVFHNAAPYVSDPADQCTSKSCLGVIGQFVKYESIDTFGGGTAGGGGANLGTVDIFLIK
jgi:hypothetical protein